MTLERLTQAHSARPFLPFRIHLADGRTLDVPHPECLAHAPQGRTFIVVKPDESYEVIDLLLVTSLEIRTTVQPKPKSKK